MSKYQYYFQAILFWFFSFIILNMLVPNYYCHGLEVVIQSIILATMFLFAGFWRFDKGCEYKERVEQK